MSFLATDTSLTDLTFSFVVLFKETMHLVSQYHKGDQYVGKRKK